MLVFEEELLEGQIQALLHENLFLLGETAHMTGMHLAAHAVVDKGVESTALKHLAHLLHGGRVEHMHLLIVALAMIPLGGAVEHDVGQCHVHLMKQRHHGGRGARCGNGKECPVLNESIEALSTIVRHLRLGVEQGAVEVAHI